MILFLSLTGRKDHQEMADTLLELGHELVLETELSLDDMSSVRACVAEHRPTIIIVEGGLNVPELAEESMESAFKENAENLIHVGAAALEFQARLVLLSSAEVFGQRGGPWIESDEPQPSSHLGQSLLKGEKLLTRMIPNLLVLRTGPRLTKEIVSVDEYMRGTKDEYVSPIFSEDLGKAIHRLLKGEAKGLFHISPNEPPVSRYDYNSSIARLWNVDLTKTSRRNTKDSHAYAWGAGLDSAKLAEELTKEIRTWRTALPQVKVRAEPVKGRRNDMAGEQEVRRVDKPWGYEIIWAHSERYVGKILFIKAGERLSLQYHEKKDETVYVLSGKMLFEVGPKDGEREDVVMKAGQSYHITPLTVHRMIAIEDTQILEASTTELNDVVRLEDSYGRAGTSAP